MPDLSRHKTIAQDVVDFLDANWTSKPSNAQIVRADSFDAAVRDLSEDSDAFIPVIVPRVDSEFGSRDTDICEVPVFVCVVASVPGKDSDKVDAWDFKAEQAADVLRDRKLRSLVLSNGVKASMKGTVSVPTTADADFLYGNEIFFSVIEMRYQYSVSVPEAVA